MSATTYNTFVAEDEDTTIEVTAGVTMGDLVHIRMLDDGGFMDVNITNAEAAALATHILTHIVTRVAGNASTEAQ